MEDDFLGLHNLGTPKSKNRRRKRLGRGIGSGVGKTCGKGHKGQKARSGGNVARHFEGGQMPLYRRIPKLGFRSLAQKRGSNCYVLLKVGQLNRFEDGVTVGLEELEKIGVKVSKADQSRGIKLLSGGKLERKLTVKVHAASAGALAAIEALGGKVELLEAGGV